MLTDEFRVVLIDDAAGIRTRIRARLEEHPGVRVVGEAGDAMSGMDAIRRTLPHLVVLDLGLPSRGGIAVLEDLDGISERPVVMVLTNLPAGIYRDRCIELGADYFLDKASEFDAAVEIAGRIASGVERDGRVPAPLPGAERV